jgi:pimeloyl-ACP methyl ester carboxylesterase
MRYAFFIVLIAYAFNGTGQQKTTVCFFPGQGSDKRIFDSLTIDTSFRLQYIAYGTPPKHCTLHEYAKQLSVQIDTTQKFILVGVSLGGMICVELCDIVKPEKVILISSAANRDELPIRYRFQRVIPLYKLFPGFVLLGGAKMLQPIVEPDRKKNKSTFKKMLGAKNPVYMKRTIGLITHWDRTSNSRNIIRIHGTKDHTIPIRNIPDPGHVVSHGSHMMTLTRAKEISDILNRVLMD